MEAYLVGGPVRDLLLKGGSVDLDIVVAGDGLSFARRLGRQLNADVMVYERFLTATLTFPDLTRLDVATARAETYERPGALPAVTPASIEQDLIRRDITINAMAIALNPPRFGTLLDPHGGATDLKNRLLRVLHPRSFLDDPTRILRLARFAARFDFAIEPGTRALLDKALAARVFDVLTADRLRAEIFLVLSEPGSAEVFSRLAELKVLDIVLPGAQPGGVFPKLIDQARRLAPFVEKGSQWDPAVVRLLLLLRGAPPKVLARAVERINLTGKARGAVQQASRLPALAKWTARAGKLSELHQGLSGLPFEVLLGTLVLMESEKSRRRMMKYLTWGRRLKPGLTGDDLMAMGYTSGPGLKRILDALLHAKLDGKVKSRKGEEAYVRKNFSSPRG